MALPKLDIPLAELYPEGRHFYYEGDDPAEWLKLIAEVGGELDLRANVSPEKLDTFYAALDQADAAGAHIRVGT